MRKKAAIKLSEEDHGRMLEAVPGQEMELSLPENPTTGYRWRVVQEGEPVCQLLRATFKAGAKPGEPGVHIRRYRVTAPGKATLQLAYGRSWEIGKRSSRSFRVGVLARA